MTIKTYAQLHGDKIEAIKLNFEDNTVVSTFSLDNPVNSQELEMFMEWVSK